MRMAISPRLAMRSYRSVSLDERAEGSDGLEADVRAGSGSSEVEMVAGDDTDDWATAGQRMVGQEEHRLPAMRHLD